MWVRVPPGSPDFQRDDQMKKPMYQIRTVYCPDGYVKHPDKFYNAYFKYKGKDQAYCMGVTERDAVEKLRDKCRDRSQEEGDTYSFATILCEQHLDKMIRGGIA